ncbi:hypothetical protein RclHR1_03420014 [Rhizophagus clarus]|uniref:Uncharacterized protein n=1 Tax=Rhizophagus clarus TaxID=94130 RepID=A0A2Z6RRJ1_9GLOM|nr:hypothetical protein RclHR1_03420014 [Rhizophagus clarus]
MQNRRNYIHCTSLKTLCPRKKLLNDGFFLNLLSHEPDTQKREPLKLIINNKKINETFYIEYNQSKE